MTDREARKHLHVGGQAVIEGVMMRSPTRIATAVRRPEGDIVVKAEPFVSLTRKNRILKLPVLRGGVVLVETFVLAIRSLSFSAEQAMAEESETEPAAGTSGGGGPVVSREGGNGAATVAGTAPDASQTGTDEPPGKKKKKKKKKTRKGESEFQMGITVVAALVLGFVIFFYLPLKLTEWIGFRDGVLFNLVDGLFRLVFIFLYIYLITRWKEMQRIFEYHGAEHKTIYAFEEEGDVTPDTALRYPRAHPRCSTSFLLIVVLVSIAVFIFLGRPETVRDRIIRFLFIPVIGGISYEVLRISAKPSVKRYLGFMFWPGIFMQRYTTREPSPDQIEVAITALNACLEHNVATRGAGARLDNNLVES